MGPEDKKGSI